MGEQRFFLDGIRHDGKMELVTKIMNEEETRVGKFLREFKGASKELKNDI